MDGNARADSRMNMKSHVITPNQDRKALYMYSAMIPPAYFQGLDDSYSALDCDISITRVEVSLSDTDALLDQLNITLGLHRRLVEMRTKIENRRVDGRAKSNALCDRKRDLGGVDEWVVTANTKRQRCAIQGCPYKRCSTSCEHC